MSPSTRRLVTAIITAAAALFVTQAMIEPTDALAGITPGALD